MVALERAPNQLNVTLESTVFEFNPWEIGSYDIKRSAYAPLRLIGSSFPDGLVSKENGAKCVRGFDNVGFIMGTSSSLFNSAFLAVQKTDEKGRLHAFVEDTLQTIGNENLDVARWPNPFREHGNTEEDMLNLVDGGMALENIPIHPLLWKERRVDIIIAVDSSADTNNWPNGTALLATYQRSREINNNASLPFPEIPKQNTFVNKGLNNKPTFFGCPSEYSNKDNKVGAPLVVYIPNSPFTSLSNVSTFTMSYSDEERDAIIENGRNVATRGRGKLDEKWPTCLGCAILLRSMEQIGKEIPGSCSDCFKEYCWDGEVDDNEPKQNYEPKMALSGCGRLHGPWWVLVVGACWVAIFSS
jgi:lysophospholipase